MFSTDINLILRQARASIKRLRTIVGILIRDISRILQPEQLVNYQDKFDIFDKVRNQQIKDSNKVLISCLCNYKNDPAICCWITIQTRTTPSKKQYLIEK